MSQGHRWCGGVGATQNQGNILGDRPCVRQSKLYRERDGGNAMKDLLGQTDLKWQTDRCQGVYAGQRVHDPLSDRPANPPVVVAQKPAAVANPPPQQQVAGMRRGNANQQSYNILTGQ